MDPVLEAVVADAKDLEAEIKALESETKALKAEIKAFEAETKREEAGAGRATLESFPSHFNPCIFLEVNRVRKPLERLRFLMVGLLALSFVVISDMSKCFNREVFWCF